jgi:8-amino-7-oxononanoate synthase
VTHTEIREWIRARAASRLGIKAGDIGLGVPLAEYGIDSLEAANLSGEIEVLLKIRIEPTTLWDYRTVWELSSYLAELSGSAIEMPETEADVDAVMKLLEAQECR